MGTEEEARGFFGRWGDDDIARFSDPGASLYHEFGLRRAKLREIFNLQVWKRGFESAIVKGFGGGRPVGDPFQLPGAFLLHNGRIIREYRHRTPADRPDYDAMSACEI